MKKLFAIAAFSFFSVFSVNTWAGEYMFFKDSYLGDQLVGEPKSDTAVCLAVVPWCMSTEDWAMTLIHRLVGRGQIESVPEVLNELEALKAKGVVVPYEQAYFPK